MHPASCVYRAKQTCNLIVCEPQHDNYFDMRETGSYVERGYIYIYIFIIYQPLYVWTIGRPDMSVRTTSKVPVLDTSILILIKRH